MFGCLRKIGCLVFLLLAAGAAWYWYTYMRKDAGEPPLTSGRPSSRDTVLLPVWERMTTEGADRGRRAVATLTQRDGPAAITVSAGDAASYIVLELVERLPKSARGVEASIVGNRLLVRSVMSLAKLSLGPLTGMLAANDTVTLAGEVSIIRPGLGQFRVRELRIKEFKVPSAMLPELISRLDRGTRPAGIEKDALPFPVPPYIGDIRIANGKITLYKSDQ